VLFLAVDLRAVDLRAVVLRAVLLRAVLFFGAALRAVLFLAVDLRAVLFFAVLLRAAAFLRGAAFFFEDEERVFAELRAVLRADVREPERDEERVVAGMADAISVLSELDASPMAESPHKLDEPASDVSPGAPVPLQSSWVINRPPGSDCDVHDSLPRCFVTFNADSMNHAHVAGKENVGTNHRVHTQRTRYANCPRRQCAARTATHEPCSIRRVR
jgi:hypothetical protein